MDLFFIRDVLQRGWERKKTLIALSAIFLILTVVGICCVSQPAVYEYHLSLCDKFVTDVCYSETNVFLIFPARLLGHSLMLLLILAGGLHPAAVLLPIAVLAYRAFTFGGSLYVFFTFYGFSGGLIVFVLYLPVHLCVDAVLLFAAAISFGRAFSHCREGLIGILYDALALFVCLATILLGETILLLVLFHPIGNIL